MDPTCTILITSTGLDSWCKKVGLFPLRWKFSPDETLLILHREGLLNRILFWGDSISSLPFSCRNRPLNFRFMDRNDYNFYFDSLRSKSLSFEKIISFFPHVKFSFLLTLFISGLVVKNRWFTVWSLLPLRRLVLFCLLCSIQEMTNVSFEGWDGRKQSKKTPSGEKKMNDHLAVKQKTNNVSQFHTRQNEKLTLFLLCSSTFACEFTNLIFRERNSDNCGKGIQGIS